MAAQEIPDSVLVDADNMESPTVDYQSELPPLIDRQAFFGDPERT